MAVNIKDLLFAVFNRKNTNQSGLVKGDVLFDGVSINANLHDGSGTAVTSTIVGSDQALDVNISGSTYSGKDFITKVALGEVSGATMWNKFGYNSDIDVASGFEVIASFGGSFNIMTSADTLDVVSGSTSDTSAGTGAQSILITGIDENHLTQTEVVTMNGTTPVTTTNQWLGVNRVVVLSSGSNDANVGDITITDTLGTVGTQAEIPAGDSVTQQCIFHTQIGFSFLMNWVWINATKISGGSTPEVTVKGISYSRVTDTFYEVFRLTIDTSQENTIQQSPNQPLIIGGREVLYFVADTDTNNTAVRARFSGIEI